MSRHPGIIAALVTAACAGYGCTTIPDADHVDTCQATDTAKDQAPVVATDGSGNWITVWASQHPLGGLGTDWDTFQSYNRNEGRQWTNVPPHLNTAATTAGKFGEVDPTITFGPKTGSVPWSSGNDQGGTLGRDLHIRVARTTAANRSLHAASAAADGNDDDSYHSPGR